MNGGDAAVGDHDHRAIAGDAFLRDCWYAAALGTDVGAAPFARTICGVELVFFRNSAGTVHALRDICPHRLVPLSTGQVVGDALQCGYHGLTFAGDGTCIRIPGQTAISARARVRAYSVVERWGWIWVWTGDAAHADPAAVPHLPWFGDARWASFQLYFPVRANYLLFSDNLLDLSHVAFTHAKSIGSPEAAEAQNRLEEVAGGLRTVREVHDATPGPFVREWGGFPGLIERCSTTTWLPPALITVEARFWDAARAITIMVVNPITPETATTSHFWIGWARDFRVGDAAETERHARENTQVIMEDVAVIERQQAVLDRHPDRAMWSIGHDAALTAARRILRERLAAERA